MKIAAVQTVATPDLERNLASAARLIARAAEAGARLVALPEYFCLMGRHDTDKIEMKALATGTVDTETKDLKVLDQKTFKPRQ